MDTPKQFVDYYAEQSLSESTQQRFSQVKQTVLRLRARNARNTGDLVVADIGCNAGTQSVLWAREGHQVKGLDISPELVELARSRTLEEGLHIDFTVGDASNLPWDDNIFDVCLVPELLEHVRQWKPCLEEYARVLKPGGTLYISTSNRLCPVQEEFDLPLYSWYPKKLKKYCEKLAITSKPELVAHAKFPAIHWFTFFQLKQELADLGLASEDRFDVIDLENKGLLQKCIVKIMRLNILTRYLGQVMTPYTVLFATKCEP